MSSGTNVEAMTQELWNKVDSFFESALIAQQDDLAFVLDRCRDNELPEIAVTPAFGKTLCLIAKSIAASRILEVGTLGGYSTIWLARAVAASSEGKVVSLELEDHHADVAAENFRQAGVESIVQVMRGPAIESLEVLVKQQESSFDFVFIDADKENNLPYFQHALQLVRQHGLIIVDNVVRQGEVLDPNHEDSRVQGVQRMLKFIANCDRVECSAMQTVGAKGYDGFLMARVLS